MDFINNSDKVKDMINRAIIKSLHEAAGEITSSAARNTRKKQDKQKDHGNI